MKKNLGNKKIFGNNLKYLMAQKGVTAKELSRDMNFPYTTVMSWLKGEYYPRIDKVEELSDYFDVNMDALILERMEKPTINYDELSPAKQKLMMLADEMSDEEIDNFVQAFLLLRNKK